MDSGDASLFITVMANHYTGCNAGRREASVFQDTATSIYNDAATPNVNFITVLHGGGDCGIWASRFASDGERNRKNAPWTVMDESYVLRDEFFTAPFPHPAYVILDWEGVVRHKLVGPCCGYESYSSCPTDTAMALNATLTDAVMALVEERAGILAARAAAAEDEPPPSPCRVSRWSDWGPCIGACGGNDGLQTKSRRIVDAGSAGALACPALVRPRACTTSACAAVDCAVGGWGGWSECSRVCGAGGTRWRSREVLVAPRDGGAACPALVQERRCPPMDACPSEQCIPELGASRTVEAVPIAGAALRGPRDVAFSPRPGVHLGGYASGRAFPTDGDEAWVANALGHALTVVPGLGSPGEGAALERSDRGFYHYLINVTGISFNGVADSGRREGRDTFGFFATCSQNDNTYLGRKESNFFMGPTMYDSDPDPAKRNLVGKNGEECRAFDDDCFLLHTDMLHEAPRCGGILHDPELETAYGSAFWQSDGWNKELVRFDFQQPHGPGLMDHTVAAVRRYPEITVDVVEGFHAGLATVGDTLFVASTGEGVVRAFNTSSARFGSTAREAYPIFSSRLPSFDYSIYVCADVTEFAAGLEAPTGLAISGGRLFVAEGGAARVSVFEIASGERLGGINLGEGALPQGMAFAPSSPGLLYIADSGTDSLLRVAVDEDCGAGPPTTALNPAYAAPTGALLEELLRRRAGGEECVAENALPDEALFEQVHLDTGYAGDGDEQNDSVMDANAALLANRTDCGFDSDLNFDALLLGGYLCHACLPTDPCASLSGMGGICINEQWTGYSCDNEIVAAPGLLAAVDAGRSYRIVATDCDELSVVACDGPDAELTTVAGDAEHGGTINRLDVPEGTSRVELQCSSALPEEDNIVLIVEQ